MASFVDTNILIYAASLHPTEIEKHHRAIELLDEPELVVSVQVLQEFYSQSTRQSRSLRLTHQQALQFLATLGDLYVVPVTFDTFLSAVAICNRYRLCYWDAAILAAAQSAGCDTVYSEDMSSTQDYGGVRIVNPFVNY